MLRLQRKRLPLRIRFWLYLFCASFMGHVLVGGALFLFYGYTTASTVINVKRSLLDDAKIVLLPFHKKVKPVHVPATISPEPKSIPVLRKPITQLTKVKSKPKKVVHKQKPVPKKKAKPVRNACRAKLEKRRLIAHKNIQQEQQKKLQERLLYVGQEDLRALNLEAAIQKEVKRFWKPPAGLPKSLSCKFAVHIDDVGQAIDTQVLASSRVLVYDACARNALSKMTFPRSVRNKKITMIF